MIKYKTERQRGWLGVRDVVGGYCRSETVLTVRFCGVTSAQLRRLGRCTVDAEALHVLSVCQREGEVGLRWVGC